MNDISTPPPVILTNDQEPTLAGPPHKPISALPKWEATARERYR